MRSSLWLGSSLAGAVGLFTGACKDDGGDPQVQEWPHLHKVLDPDANKKDEE